MGLEDVKKGLEKQLKQERQAIEKETENKREELMQKAKKEIEAYAQKMREKTAQEQQAIEKKEVSTAKLAAKKEVLKAKKSLIDKAFAAALQELVSQPDKKRKAILERLVTQAANSIDVKTVYVSKQDKDLVKADAVKTASIAGGVICENEQGTQRVDLSYETLLAEVREQHLKEVAQALF